MTHGLEVVKLTSQKVGHTPLRRSLSVILACAVYVYILEIGTIKNDDGPMEVQTTTTVEKHQTSSGAFFFLWFPGGFMVVWS